MKKKTLLKELYNPIFSNMYNKPRRNMKVWIRDLKTKTACDSFVNFVSGRYTDVGIFAIDDGVTPRQWGGISTMGTSSSTVIDGKTPWGYLYDKLHNARINVTAWIWITHYSYWGTPSGVDLSIPNNSTYNDAGIYNFHDSTARTRLISEIKDFVDNNKMEGLVFNMEGTTANITQDDMTNFIKDLRIAIPDKELAWHSGGTISGEISYKLDTVSWLRNGYLNLIYIMAYYTENEVKSYFLSSGSISKSDKRVSIGVGAESNYATPSDFRYKLLMDKNEGYRNYFHFIWEDNFDDDVGFRNAVDDFLYNRLTANQGDITKVSASPAYYFTLTVSGSVQTTNYADVTDHLYSGPLKKHIETGFGTENPAVIYSRNNSTTTRILIGDFEP